MKPCQEEENHGNLSITLTMWIPFSKKFYKGKKNCMVENLNTTGRIDLKD